MTAPSWMADALCAGMPVGIWYPDRSHSAIWAKTICAQCPVSDASRQYATDTGERHGWWGGVSFAEGPGAGSVATLTCSECGCEFEHEMSSTGGARPAVCSPRCRQDRRVRVRRAYYEEHAS